MLNVLYALCKLKKCLGLGVKMEVMCFVLVTVILYFSVFLNYMCIIINYYWTTVTDDFFHFTDFTPLYVPAKS